MLTKESIEKYQEIFKKNYGYEISFDEAREQGENLVRFFELLLKADRQNKDKNSGRE